MKRNIGYMFITSSGYDPEKGKGIKDPYLGDTPTLGACMPNIRRRVTPGDAVFLVSGRVPGCSQFVVGGFEVAEKISHMEAYKRFPHLRLRQGRNGELVGNVIVDEFGAQHYLDNHDSFQTRVNDYIVGRELIALTEPLEIARARAETLTILQELFGKAGAAPINIIGRCRKMTQEQIVALRKWLLEIKRGR